MMSDISNLYIYQNTDFEVPLDFFDDDGPIDMSNYTFYSQIRKLYSTQALSEFSFDLSNAENGIVRLILSSEDSIDLKEGKYQYDILVEDTSGEILKVLEGLVFIMPTVTRIE